MIPEFAHVPLADIDLTDQTFVVTYRPELSALQRSIAAQGVIAPVHLRRTASPAPLQMVCGAKRLHICQQLGHTSVPALLYPATALPDHQAFLLAFYDNLGCRSFNAVEKARVLWHLRTRFAYDDTTLVKEFCPLLELPPRLDTVDDYCALAALGEPLHTAVVDSALPIDTALWIGRQAEVDRHALLAIFTSLKLGSNRARELATYIEEICQRDACGAAALLQALGATELVADASLDGPHKLERLRTRLRQARYPHLSRYEQRFQDATRRLRLPAPVSLRPPPYFEGQQYQVTFSFRSSQDLQDYAQRLLDVATSDAMTELLTLL